MSNKPIEYLIQTRRAAFYAHYSTLRRLVPDRRACDQLINLAGNLGAEQAVAALQKDPVSFALRDAQRLEAATKMVGLLRNVIAAWAGYESAMNSRERLKAPSPATSPPRVGGRLADLDYGADDSPITVDEPAPSPRKRLAR